MNFRIRFLWLSGCVLSLCAGNVRTQQIADTVVSLRQVEVWGNETGREAGAGSRQTRLAGSLLEINRSRSLTELLAENTQLNIKTTGRGGLATASFRGTSSQHTQVEWNGIVINPAMGGSVDFSQIPVFFMDEVTLYYGNSPLGNGTGGLGGTIGMENRPDWSKTGVHGKLFGEYGSYDTYTGGISLSYVRKRWAAQTRFFYQQSENDYRYLNKVLSVTPFYEHRQQASYRQWGVLQETYYDAGRGGLWSSGLWIQAHTNEIPQPVNVNHRQRENQDNLNLRWRIHYKKEKGPHRYSVTGAWLREHMEYRRRFESGLGNLENKNTVHTGLLKGDYRYRTGEAVRAGAGLSIRYDRAGSDNYSETAELYTGTAYGSLTWIPRHGLTVQAKITAEGSRKWFLPAYSLGAKYGILDDLIVLRLSTAYHVHAPTLNDLYWNPGGNPALRPEKGFSQEAGIRIRSRRGRLWYTIDLTGYYSDIRNWIVWQPVSGSYIWTPQNLQRVRSYGAEAEGSVSYLAGGWVNRLQFGYGYTPSVNRTRHGDKDATVNRQLPYIPRHKGHLQYRLEVKGFAFHYGISYTGKRYTTTDESYYTPAYWLHNASLSWRTGWRNGYAVEIRFAADNLLNAYYESTKSYPMPLRNFSGSLLFSF